MPLQKSKAENPVGKIYRVTDPELRLKHGELRLVVERRFQKIYQHAPLWASAKGISLYPEALWYSDEIRGVPTFWQPSSREFHLLLAGETIAVDDGKPHPLAQEILGPIKFNPVSSTISTRTAQGVE